MCGKVYQNQKSFYDTAEGDKHIQKFLLCGVYVYNSFKKIFICEGEKGVGGYPQKYLV